MQLIDYLDEFLDEVQRQVGPYVDTDQAQALDLIESHFGRSEVPPGWVQISAEAFNGWARDESPQRFPPFSDFRSRMRRQLESDQARFGDTWKHRAAEGQEERTLARYRDYIDQFRHGGNPVPWLKIVGGALICWVRENHPDYAER